MFNSDNVYYNLIDRLYESYNDEDLEKFEDLTGLIVEEEVDKFTAQLEAEFEDRKEEFFMTLRSKIKRTLDK